MLANQNFQVILHKNYFSLMKILLRKVEIKDLESPFNNQTKDILIENGKISRIADTLNSQVDREISDSEKLYVSRGWLDPFASITDPGFEFKETVDSGSAAAFAGGYTDVLVLPNTFPSVQNKAGVLYFQERSASLPATLHALGAISQHLEGKNLSEMFDMNNNGAVAFSDGLRPLQDSGLLLKAFLYVKAFTGLIVEMPLDLQMAPSGVMNEGLTSTRLGLPGLPAVAENIIVNRDIELLRYTGSRLHLTGISTKRSVEMVREAKAEGLDLTCSATPYHLFFSDEDVANYDTNLKVNPPLRSIEDRDALRNGILDGTIDCIASHHMPQDWDHKECEFGNAEFGMTGFQTAFAAVSDALQGRINVDRLVDLFCTAPRKIFGLNGYPLDENKPAALTVFSLEGQTLLTEKNNKSLSGNSAFLNHGLKGRVVAVANKDNFFVNE